MRCIYSYSIEYLRKWQGYVGRYLIRIRIVGRCQDRTSGLQSRVLCVEKFAEFYEPQVHVLKVLPTSTRFLLRFEVRL